MQGAALCRVLCLGWTSAWGTGQESRSQRKVRGCVRVCPVPDPKGLNPAYQLGPTISTSTSEDLRQMGVHLCCSPRILGWGDQTGLRDRDRVHDLCRFLRQDFWLCGLCPLRDLGSHRAGPAPRLTAGGGGGALVGNARCSAQTAAVGAVPLAAEHAGMHRVSATFRGRTRPKGRSGDGTPSPGNSTGENPGRERGSALFSRTGKPRGGGRCTTGEAGDGCAQLGGALLREEGRGGATGGSGWHRGRGEGAQRKTGSRANLPEPLRPAGAAGEAKLGRKRPESRWPAGPSARLFQVGAAGSAGAPHLCSGRSWRTWGTVFALQGDALVPSQLPCPTSLMVN